MRPRRRPHVLVIVQNLPLPGDRRVWLECQALVAAGYEVSAITPMAAGDPEHAELDGVHLYKYPAPVTGDRPLDFVREFAYCWLHTARLAVRVMRRRRVDVLQACNPPDTFWLLALLLRPAGVRFIFDQHDLCPEVYLSRFARPRRAVLTALRALERATYRTAHHVIATNDTYRAVAMGRGGVPAERVTVVRTGPDPERMRRGPAVPALRNGRAHLVAYVGVMGPQDGVDIIVDAIDEVVHTFDRTDCHFAILGTGDRWATLRQEVTRRGLDPWVTMPGRVSDEDLFAHLSTADIGLCPDPPGPLNDVSTMNKTMEYMAFELPVLAFDLPETRVSAGDAADYVQQADAQSYAKGIVALLDDPDRRAEMGAVGRQRVEDVLAWPRQRGAYVGVYDALTRTRPTPQSGDRRRPFRGGGSTNPGSQEGSNE